MTIDTLIEKYGFLADKKEYLEAAGFKEEIDLFKVVSHFIKKDDFATFKAFIEAGYDIDSCETGDFGSSLLHNAIRYGRMDAFNYLIEKGANINHADAVGWTPLMESIIDSRPEFGRILVEQGADQTIANKRGANAKMLAMKFGQQEFLGFLS